MGSCCASCARGEACETDSLGAVQVYGKDIGLRFMGCYPLWAILPEGVVIYPGQMRGYLTAVGGMGFPVGVANAAGDIAVESARYGYGNMTPDFLALVAIWKNSRHGQRLCGVDPSSVQYWTWLRDNLRNGNEAARMAYAFLRNVYSRTHATWLGEAINRLHTGTPVRKKSRIKGYQGSIAMNGYR